MEKFEVIHFVMVSLSGFCIDFCGHFGTVRIFDYDLPKFRFFLFEVSSKKIVKCKYVRKIRNMEMNYYELTVS